MEICFRAGGRLYVPSSEPDLLNLATLTGVYGDFWVGLIAEAPNPASFNDWIWLDGRSLSSTVELASWVDPIYSNTATI